MNKRLRGSLLLLLAALVWGMAFAAQSSAMDSVQPFTFNGGRSVITALALGLILLIKPDFSAAENAPKAPLKAYLKTGGVMGIIMFAASSLQQAGLVYTTAGKSGFITALYIILVPLLGAFAGKRPRAVLWLSVVLSLAGLCLLCMKERLGLGLGELLTLGCALAFSLHILYIDRFAGALNAARLCLVQFAVSAALCWIAAFLFETPRLSALYSCLGSLLYVGVASGAVGYTLQILGQRNTEPTLASLLMCLESVFAALGGWLILGDALSARELLGCALMLAGCVIAQLPGGKRGKTTP